MIKFIVSLTICWVSQVLILSAQTRKSVHGIILDEQTGNIVRNVQISAPNIGQSVSSDKGEFYIETTYCSYCRAGYTISLNVYHPDYGYDLIQQTIDSSYRLRPIYIKKSYQKVLGIVKNRDGSFLEGIKVTCQLGIPDFQEPVVLTDEFGRFSFILNQRLIGRVHSFDMFFKDPHGRYLDKNISKSIDRQLYIEVYLDPATPTPALAQPFDNSSQLPNKPLLEEKIRSILHKNGQNRGGSKVLSTYIDDQYISGNKLIMKGTYQATNYLLYRGDFRCTMDLSNNRIIQLEFRNIVDQTWTPVNQYLLEND